MLNLLSPRLIAYIILVGILTLACQLVAPSLLHEHAWYTYLFNAFVTVISFFIYNKGIDKGGFDFPKYFMLASTFRLLFSAVALLVYIIWAKSVLASPKIVLIHFATNFFVFYILFTVFEISSLLSKLHRNSSDTQTDNENLHK